MKVIQSSVFRAVCAIASGYLLVIYRNDMLHWATIAIGALFFLSGLISVVAHYAEKRRMANMAEHLSALSEVRGDNDAVPVGKDMKSALAPTFPIVGLGSMVLGLILACMSTTFVAGMMYVLAGLLILGALSMMFNLSMARRFASIGAGYWLVPTLLLLIGILMIAKPSLLSEEWQFRVLGWALIVYGVVECINAFKIYRCRRQYERIQAEQEAAMKTEESPKDDAEEVKTEETKPIENKVEDDAPQDGEVTSSDQSKEEQSSAGFNDYQI